VNGISISVDNPLSRASAIHEEDDSRMNLSLSEVGTCVFFQDIQRTLVFFSKGFLTQSIMSTHGPLLTSLGSSLSPVNAVLLVIYGASFNYVRSFSPHFLPECFAGTVYRRCTSRLPFLPLRALFRRRDFFFSMSSRAHKFPSHT